MKNCFLERREEDFRETSLNNCSCDLNSIKQKATQKADEQSEFNK